MNPVRLGLAMIACGLFVLGRPGHARAGLDGSGTEPDPAFAWSEAGGGSTPVGTYTELKLTSQVWKGIAWNHALYVYGPAQVPYADSMLLLVTGRGNGDKPGVDDHKTAFGLARACG